MPRTGIFVYQFNSYVSGYDRVFDGYRSSVRFLLQHYLSGIVASHTQHAVFTFFPKSDGGVDFNATAHDLSRAE